MEGGTAVRVTLTDWTCRPQVTLATQKFTNDKREVAISGTKNFFHDIDFYFWYVDSAWYWLWQTVWRWFYISKKERSRGKYLHFQARPWKRLFTHRWWRKQGFLNRRWMDSDNFEYALGKGRKLRRGRIRRGYKVYERNSAAMRHSYPLLPLVRHSWEITSHPFFELHKTGWTPHISSLVFQKIARKICIISWEKCLFIEKYHWGDPLPSRTQ